MTYLVAWMLALPPQAPPAAIPPQSPPVVAVLAPAPRLPFAGIPPGKVAAPVLSQRTPKSLPARADCGCLTSGVHPCPCELAGGVCTCTAAAPTLLVCSITGCGPCVSLASALRVPYRLAKDDAATFARYGVTAFPTLLRLDARGNVINRHVGYTQGSPLPAWARP